MDNFDFNAYLDKLYSAKTFQIEKGCFILFF